MFLYGFRIGLKKLPITIEDKERICDIAENCFIKDDSLFDLPLGLHSFSCLSYDSQNSLFGIMRGKRNQFKTDEYDFLSFSCIELQLHVLSLVGLIADTYFFQNRTKPALQIRPDLLDFFSQYLSTGKTADTVVICIYKEETLVMAAKEEYYDWDIIKDTFQKVFLIDICT